MLHLSFQLYLHYWMHHQTSLHECVPISCNILMNFISKWQSTLLFNLLSKMYVSEICQDFLRLGVDLNSSFEAVLSGLPVLILPYSAVHTNYWPLWFSLKGTSNDKTS